MRSPARSYLPLLLCLLLTFRPGAAGAGEDGQQLGPAIEQLISSGALLVTANGRPLVHSRSDEPFVPASTIKIATALIALEVLGPDYRFPTDLLLRPDGKLCIKGYGDPFLTSERVHQIATALHERGLRRITGVVLDDSSFALESLVDGSERSANPYDAPNGSLAVNFNALPLLKDAPTGKLTSPEPKLPLLPLARIIGAQLPAGQHRVNVDAFAATAGLSNPLRYTGELFQAVLPLHGITVTGAIETGPAGPQDRLLYRHESPKTVAQVIRACLKHSSNFIANQLFLASGARLHGYPATWQKGRAAAEEVLVRRHRLPADQFLMVEGSGLSRQNRVTASFMITLLEAFKPYAALLSTVQGIPLKSGTMRHIYCYAGYFTTADRFDPFVILLNQTHNTRRQLLDLLHRHHRGAMAPALSAVSAHGAPGPR